MNLKEDKEQVIDMLTSEDKEIRSLALNSIRNNYDTSFKFSLVKYEVYSLNISNSYTSYNINIILDRMKNLIFKNSFVEQMLNLIIEYNELKGKQG